MRTWFATNIHKILLKIINARVSVPSFMWVLSSLVVACYIFHVHAELALTPFGQKLILGPLYWSVTLVVSDLICLIGMIVLSNKIPLVRIGAIVSFMMWVFGNLSIYQVAGWNLIMAWTVPYIFQYAYMFLAASQGVFKKNTPLDKPQSTD